MIAQAGRASRRDRTSPARAEAPPPIDQADEPLESASPSVLAPPEPDAPLVPPTFAVNSLCCSFCARPIDDHEGQFCVACERHALDLETGARIHAAEGARSASTLAASQLSASAEATLALAAMRRGSH